MSDRPLLEFQSADISNGEIVVVEGLDLTVRKGEFVYITGRVGSGKTSIIRTITGENPLFGGKARVGDFDLAKLKRKHIPALRRCLGVVFQDFQLLMDRSVEENLLFALKATGWKDKGLISERIDTVLQAVDLTSKGHKLPHQLSGGERQRAAIARALLNVPPLILADEPTGNLDEEAARDILKLLHEINSTGITVLMVTHNMQLIKEFPGRVLRVDDSGCREVESSTDEKAI